MTKNTSPIMVLGTTETYQVDLHGQKSDLMIGGNGLLSALAASKLTQTTLVTGVGSEIIAKLNVLKEYPNLNLNYLDLYPNQKSFFYLSNLDSDGVEMSGTPEFNCHRDFILKTFQNLPNCKILHCSGTDPDFYLNNISNITYEILSATTIGHYLKQKRSSVIKLLNLADVVFLNQSEFENLRSELNLADKMVVVTKGKEGLEVLLNDLKLEFKAESIATKNTVNAGDVLAGSVIGNLANLNDLINVEQINLETVKQIVNSAQTEVVHLLRQDPFYRIKL